MNSARTRSQMRTKSLCEVSALLPHMFGCGSTLSLKPYAEVSSASLLVGVGRRGTAVPKQAAAAGEVIGRGCPQQAPDAPKHPTACANQPPHASVSDRVDHGSVCCRDYAKLKQARTSTGSKNEQKKRRKKPTLTRHFLTAAEGTFTKAPFSTGYHTFIELNNLTNKQFLFLLMPAFGSSVQATFKQRSSNVQANATDALIDWPTDHRRAHAETPSEIGAKFASPQEKNLFKFSALSFGTEPLPETHVYSHHLYRH